MNSRTLLVDSSYLLKRSYNGFKDTYTLKFGNIAGLYGFFITIRKLIKQHKINKVVLCWDGEMGGKYRYLIDNEYKANRENKDWYDKIELSDREIKLEKEKKESILKNRKRIQSYAEELFIRQIEIDEIEADDLIADYCMKYHDKEEIFIFTNDRDFCQLLDLNVTIVFGNIEEPITKYNYIMHFDHHYSNSLTIKVICGDTSDNIKGVGGVKEDNLLKYFPDLKFRYMSVKEICQTAHKINEDRIKNKKKKLIALSNITDNVDRLKINYKLINLKNPFLNEQAIDELLQLDLPLSPEGRNSKNLYNMMVEDDFMKIYNGSFVDFVQPFYTVIMGEKQLLLEYDKNNKKNI